MSRPPCTKTQQRFWRRAGLAAVSIAAAFTITEALVRLFHLAPPLPKVYRDEVYVPDPHLPYHQKPLISRNELSSSREFTEVFTHNSAGFRDVEHSLRKPPGVFRILAVGDSFTYGAGAPFDQTYPYLLESFLNHHYSNNPRVEVIKAGIGGFFPEAERLLVQHYGLAYEPDLLLVSVNAGDVVDSQIGIDGVRVFPGFLKTPQARRLGYVGTFLSMHSHAARIVCSLWDRVQERHGMADVAIEDAWKTIDRELEAMRQLISAAGGQMVVCFIPADSDDDGGDKSASRKFKEWALRRGVPFVDATDRLRAATSKGTVFWPHDRHCTPLGYRAVAEAVSQALVSNRVVSSNEMTTQ